MEEHRLITEHTWQCMSLAELKLFLISNTYIGLDNIQSLCLYVTAVSEQNFKWYKWSSTTAITNNNDNYFTNIKYFMGSCCHVWSVQYQDFH